MIRWPALNGRYSAKSLVFGMASRIFSTTSDDTARMVIAAGLFRRIAPSDIASSADIAKNSGSPHTVRITWSADRSSDQFDGNSGRVSVTHDQAVIAPMVNDTISVTTALEISTCQRRGSAASVIRICPNRYSDVATITAIAISAMCASWDGTRNSTV